MKRIKSYDRLKYEDSLWQETMSERCVKNELMKKYRFPARYARKMTNKLLKSAIQYWAYEDVY